VIQDPIPFLISGRADAGTVSVDPPSVRVDSVLTEPLVALRS
jgi:hypothetical protein